MTAATTDRAPMGRYARGSVWLHWIIGGGVIANIAIAELTEDLARPQRLEWMGLHMAIGISVLVLTLVRIGWRIAHPGPGPLPGIPAWQHAAARFVHMSFYVLLLALPLSAWLWMSARPEPVSVNMFSLFNWPVLPVGANEGLADAMHEAHELGGQAMFILILLHIAGAAKHQLIDRVPILRRMSLRG